MDHGWSGSETMNIKLQKLRLYSGLFLFVFVLTHLLNHSLGLISLELMEQVRVYRSGFWRFLPISILLYLALLTHFILAAVKIAQRRTLRMPISEAAQLLLALMIPISLAGHLIHNRFAAELFGTNDNYTYEIYRLWVAAAFPQSMLIFYAWTHGCIGVHFWLRLRPWYFHLQPYLLAFAVLLPVLAFLAFAQQGQALEALGKDPVWLGEMAQQHGWPNDEQNELQSLAGKIAKWVFYGLFGAAFVYRPIRHLIARRNAVHITYEDGRKVRAIPGATLLETSRAYNVPHAAVCGGHGRCSTCRVRISDGMNHLPEALPDEQEVLRRVHASAQVRLACQIRPQKDLKVTRMLPPEVGPGAVTVQERVEAGVEQDIVVLFADLRGFTRLSEAKLPYDVVFILNQYFKAMGEAITQSGGQIDKFIGDGIMALFGINNGVAVGAAQALKAAQKMGAALEKLNESLNNDLPQPLKMGIGIHAGPAIVGQMGYGKAVGLTAIGDTVNTASRLESMTKEMKVELIVSHKVAMLANLDLGDFVLEKLPIRGRQEVLDVVGIRNLTQLPD